MQELTLRALPVTLTTTSPEETEGLARRWHGFWREIAPAPHS